MKMRGFFLSIGLCAFCLGALICADDVEIYNMSNFKQFYGDFLDEGRTFERVYLKCDLNFTDQEWKMERPLGQSISNPTDVRPFNGTFNGNGHTVSGLNMTLEDSDAGFFHSITGGAVSNLHFDESCFFSGVQAGSLAAKVSGNTTITNVSSQATVLGEAVSGGIVGFVNQGTNVVFDSCHANGNITTDPDKSNKHFCSAGGIIGCANNSVLVVNNSHFGGQVLTKTGSARTDSKGVFASGIVSVSSDGRIQLSVENCVNTGEIKCIVNNGAQFSSTFAAASGIVSVLNVSDGDSFNITNCHNNGTVSLDSQTSSFQLFSSGILSVAKVNSQSVDLLVAECSNSVNVSANDHCGSSEQVYAAGIVSSGKGLNISVVSCINTGNISSSAEAAGIAMYAESIKNSVNHGGLTGKKTYGIGYSTQQSLGVVGLGKSAGTVFSYAIYSQCSNNDGEWFRGPDTSSETTPTGTPIILNEEKRWVRTTEGSKDLVDHLNGFVQTKGFTLWWTSDLKLGHRVKVEGLFVPPFVKEHGSRIVAGHGETLSTAMEREGAKELLNLSPEYEMNNTCGSLDDFVRFDCSLTAYKKVHTLVFRINTPVELKVTHDDVPTEKDLAPLQRYINSKDYLIVNEDGSKTFFNASAPVTKDASYTVRKAQSLVVVIDGSVNDDDIKTIVGVVDDDGAIVRVVVAGSEDGRTSLIITINEEQVASIKDLLTGCIKTLA